MLSLACEAFLKTPPSLSSGATIPLTAPAQPALPLYSLATLSWNFLSLLFLGANDLARLWPEHFGNKNGKRSYFFVYPCTKQQDTKETIPVENI